MEQENHHVVGAISFFLPSHQLPWKCKKALSKRKVVFLPGSVHQTMLAGGRVCSSFFSFFFGGGGGGGGGGGRGGIRFGIDLMKPAPRNLVGLAQRLELLEGDLPRGRARMPGSASVRFEDRSAKTREGRVSKGESLKIMFLVGGAKQKIFWKQHGSCLGPLGACSSECSLRSSSHLKDQYVYEHLYDASISHLRRTWED